MMSAWIVFAIGMFLGLVVGIVILGALHLARRQDDETAIALLQGENEVLRSALESRLSALMPVDGEERRRAAIH